MTKIQRSNLPRITQRLPISKKSLLIAFCCVFGVLLLNSVGNSSKKKSSPSLRSSATDFSRESKIATISSSSNNGDNLQTQEKSVAENENEVDENAVQNAVGKAKSDMQYSVKDEFLVTMDWMHDAIVDAKTSIHRSIDYFLKDGGYTDNEVEAIDSEVANEVEEKLKADLMEQVNKAVDEANADLNSLVKAEIDDKYDTKEIEKDVDSIRSYYVEKLKAKVDSLEGEMEDKIHTVSQDIEKKILKEKLGLEESTEELEDTEMNSLVLEKEDEVFEADNDKAASFFEDINEAEKSLEEEIKKTLKEFLVDKKKVSASEANEIEKKVVEGLKVKVKNIMEEEVDNLEETANIDADEVADIADENLSVIESAKLLGMAADTSDSAVAIVESSLDKLKVELESSFTALVKSSRSRAIQRLKDSTKDVEKTVLEEKGIDISEKELDDLVEKETKTLDDKTFSI